MYTYAWGYYYWGVIHITLQCFPLSTSEDFKQLEIFLTSFGNSLPCPACRQHYLDYIGQHPAPTSMNGPVVKRRNDLVQWGIDLHNAVNQRTAKPVLTDADAMNEIRKNYFNVETWSILSEYQARLSRMSWKEPGTEPLTLVEKDREDEETGTKPLTLVETDREDEETGTEPLTLVYGSSGLHFCSGMLAGIGVGLCAAYVVSKCKSKQSK